MKHDLFLSIITYDIYVSNKSDTTRNDNAYKKWSDKIHKLTRTRKQQGSYWYKSNAYPSKKNITNKNISSIKSTTKNNQWTKSYYCCTVNVSTMFTLWRQVKLHPVVLLQDTYSSSSLLNPSQINPSQINPSQINYTIPVKSTIPSQSNQLYHPSQINIPSQIKHFCPCHSYLPSVPAVANFFVQSNLQSMCQAKASVLSDANSNAFLPLFDWLIDVDR